MDKSQEERIDELESALAAIYILCEVAQGIIRMNEGKISEESMQVIKNVAGETRYRKWKLKSADALM